MSTTTNERTARHRSESKTGDILFARPLEMARAVLPLFDKNSELADMSFIDAENTLAKLNTQAESAMVEYGRVPRKVKRTLSRCAHRLLEITADEPDLHEALTFELIGHAADATGERELLEITIEQAREAHISSDTNSNLQAIQGALELDLPFTKVIRTLNQRIVPGFEIDGEPHEPLGTAYDYLFEPSAAGNVKRNVQLFDDNGEPIANRYRLLK